MKNWNRYIVLGLMGFLFFHSSAYALVKEETIYTVLDTDGKPIHSSVTNHLFSNDQKTFEDETDLKNILNINGKEKFTQNGSLITWENTGKDLFYRGTTDKEQPIQVEVTYYLNDEKMDPKEMIGKKGRVKIIFSFQNQLKHIVNGKNVYTPFVVTTGLMVDNRFHSNIEVQNGKWINRGSKSVITGIATPGFYESFGLEELKNLNSITISYDTEKFSIGNIYMIATPKLLEEKDLEAFQKMDALASNMTLLKQNMDQIEKGAETLKSGSQELMVGSNQIQSSIDLLYENITKLKNGSIALEEGLLRLMHTLEQIQVGVLDTSQFDHLKQANESAILELVGKTGMNLDSLQVLYENQLKNYQGNDATLLQAKNAYEMIQLLMMNNEAIDQTLLKMQNLSNQMDTLFASLKSALSSLHSGTTDLMNGLGLIENGMHELSSGMNSWIQGSKTFDTGLLDLHYGIRKMNQEGISPLYTRVHQVNDTSKILEQMIGFSKEYHGYASNNANKTTFIYKMKSLK